MKSLILKIIILAGIATLILARDGEGTFEINENFVNLFNDKYQKNYSGKSHFMITLESPNHDLAIKYSETASLFNGLDFNKNAEIAATKCYLKTANGSIIGSSTLQPWESEITDIKFRGSLLSNNNKSASFSDVEIKIPVLGIISKEGAIVTKKTHQAFNFEQFPDIIYNFDHALIHVDEQDSVTITTTGNLSMAGVTRPVSLLAKGNRLKNGEFQLHINKTLKMTDFDINPPALLLGTIRAGNEITLNFDLNLSTSLNFIGNNKR